MQCITCNKQIVDEYAFFTGPTLLAAYGLPLGVGAKHVACMTAEDRQVARDACTTQSQVDALEQLFKGAPPCAG